ncbi:MAG TPA: Glu/Leu/Phe/Val dehydrogenase dimerization domain-containing protein [Candidatus Dormibacteraeota bacterium]|nr:Glu/Leu/Phe/Val dehydrogenase dimerization domain-containing protein [Candidatus Dormibacteraeota bacterium]
MSQTAPSPYLVTEWADEVSGARAWFVIDRLVSGMCSGGIRMRKGLVLQEVVDLARTMSHKMAVLEIPYGGAKAGIDWDPGAPDAQAVLQRFIGAIRPYVAERYATGADLGTHEDDIIKACQLAGLTHPLQAGFKNEGDLALQRVRQALALSSEGQPITELMAGYGVAECTLEACEFLGIEVRGASVALQGFGNVGGAAARYLHRAGARIVVIADIQGALVDEAGLDIPRLLEVRDRFGSIDRSRLPGRITRSPEAAWLEQAAQIVIPAAIGGAIRPDNQASIRTQLLVEAANNPVTAQAEAELEARQVVILPDFVANAAAAFLFCGLLEKRLAPNIDSIFGATSRQLRSTTKALLERSRSARISSRRAAEEIAEERLGARLRKDAWQRAGA